MKRPVNWHNFNYAHNRLGERNHLASLTVPNMTLSLEEILRRYVRGESVPIRQPIYTDDDLIPDNMERMTPQERADLAVQLGYSLDEFRRHQHRKPDDDPIDVTPAPPAEPAE